MRLIKTLSKLKKVPELVAKGAAASSTGGGDRLSAFAPPASNPGNLRARCYVPPGLVDPAPLVVVLHGCTQDADGYDRGSGWSQLAEANGFALLFPEQTRANNQNLCFNWFQMHDTQRGQGEAASIHAMVEAMCARHPIDRGRVFVTGLSAGGAMASVMLATYPETFAGGAIIAGLPYGCASGLGQAFECMSGGGAQADAATLGARVRGASPHAGPWPRVSVWHGSADHTVAPSNGDAVVRQWANVHGVSAGANRRESIDGYPRSAWFGADGRPIVEQYSISGMGHGTPLKLGKGTGRSGVAMPHMIDAGISSTDRIAAFFGIAVEETGSAATEAARPGTKPAPGPQKVIEDALRAAGLMR